MATETDTVQTMIQKFKSTFSLQRLEDLADSLGETGDKRAIAPLLSRLGDIQVQSDPDVEDAVCGALVRLGVMKKLGNQNFRFLENDILSPEAKTALQEYHRLLPQKYSQAIPAGGGNSQDMVKAYLDVLAQQGDTTVLIFSCPFCCTGNEGIKSELREPARRAILSAISSGQGVATPCPNCSADLLLVADDDIRGQIQQLL